MKILVTGATGQIGSELVPELRNIYGNENIIALGHKREPSKEILDGPFEIADITKKEQIEILVKKYDIKIIYHLASILSAAGEKKPEFAWGVNMLGLRNILEIAKKYSIKIFWPSSIAVFGPTTPKKAPQETILQPTTMYGITKVAGELLCQYYSEHFNMDIRSLRFPGIISYKTMPGGGTTDYAVEIFYEAVRNKKYFCFVKEKTILPMMYMPDCIKSIVQLMEAQHSKLNHVCYNIGAVSFSVKELADEIKKHIPNFECGYRPDFRQEIADSWPSWIDDSAARNEWKWKPDYGIKEMTKNMLEKISEKLNIQILN